MRARARLNDQLDPRVVIGEHGGWQACEALGALGHDPFGPNGSNFNATAMPGGSHDLPLGSANHLANIAGHAAIGCATAAASGGRCGPGALSGAAGAFGRVDVSRSWRFSYARKQTAIVAIGYLGEAVVLSAA